MVRDPLVPLGDKDGTLVFLSEKLRDIEQERSGLVIRSVDVRRIFNDGIREVFDPLPQVNLHGTLAVASGIKIRSGGSVTNLSGEQNAIQTLIEFVASDDYEAAQTQLVDDSRSHSSRKVIGLMTRTTSELDDHCNEIFRCKRITELHRNDADQEIRDYCRAQQDRATRLAAELKSKLKSALQGGSFIFKGQRTAVSTEHADLSEASKQILSVAAAQVFDRYGEAPVRTNTDNAEKILKLSNPAAINNALDPLGLVQVNAGRPSFKTDEKALVSIRDYVDRNGSAVGKQLLEHFSADPFGWSQDTTRYILAIMLLAGEIKLTVSGREVSTAGPLAIDALKTNKSFGQIGVSLRDERPSNEALSRASERLTELLGDTVIPLEQEISKATLRNFPRFQSEYGSLQEKLGSLGVGGSDRAQALNQSLTDLLSTDASDAPQLLGAEESMLYNNLKWAADARRALDNGLEQKLQQLQNHKREIEALPDTGAPGALRLELKDELSSISNWTAKDDFFRHSSDLASSLTKIKSCVGNTVIELLNQQNQRLKDGGTSLNELPEWREFNQDERGTILNRLDALEFTATEDLAGLNALLARNYDINTTLDELKRSIEITGQERLRQRIADEQDRKGKEGPSRLETVVSIPAKVSTVLELEAVFLELEELKARARLYDEIEVSFSFNNEE